MNDILNRVTEACETAEWADCPVQLNHQDLRFLLKKIDELQHRLDAQGKQPKPVVYDNDESISGLG